MRLIMAGIAALSIALPALAQHWNVDSMQTNSLIGLGQLETVMHTTPGVFQREVHQLMSLSGSGPGNPMGTVQVDGVSRLTTEWSGSSISWYADTSLSLSIVDPFEDGDYGDDWQLNAMMRMYIYFDLPQETLVRTRVTLPWEIGAVGDGWQAWPTSIRLEHADGGQLPIGFGLDEIEGLLQPGQYRVYTSVRSQYVKRPISPAREGSAFARIGGIVEIVPSPSTGVALCGTLLLLNSRRRA